ncbi:MAG TPA: mevalonate kinase [Polyangiaceae bacterium]|nr:mevalonate kinase [Polyangiaceae bacterium]
MACACGKVILLGEHAVVYDVPAIVAGLGQGASAQARANDEYCLNLAGVLHRASNGTELSQAFTALLTELGMRGAPPVRVDATLNIPAGMGLGASAALGVAIARAVRAHSQLSAPHGASGDESEWSGDDDNSAAVRDAAMAWERVFHGNPSGIDTAAAVYGGCFRFSKKGGVKPLQLAVDLPLSIALSGAPASTKAMVEQVANFRSRRPEVMEKTLAAIGSLVENAVLCMQAGDLYGLGKLMDLNQVLLSGLFLSTPEIENACTVAREAGALGAKLTGSGGGGAVIALSRSVDQATVLQAWKAAGIECFAATVHANAQRGTV